MIFKYVAFSCLFLGCFAFARTWENLEGKKIEAEFIRIEGEQVVLSMQKKEISYPLSKLSSEDNEWIKAKILEEQQRVYEKVKQLRGLRKNVPIDHRFREGLGGYFSHGVQKNCVKKFEEGKYGHIGTVDDWLVRNPDKNRCVIYCPESYDGSDPYGVFLYISPGNEGVIKSNLQSILDRFKLIGVSASGVGNKTPGKKLNPMIKRVTLSLDALSVVERDYKIDPNRRVVGGLSGGGHMAFLTAALYPELFQGAISSAAQSYLPEHFPGFKMSDFTKGRRSENKWVVISGNKDYNYPEILKTSKIWKSNGLNYRFIDVPGMGHQLFKPEFFVEALGFIGLKAP